jgi:hypothetical protein
MDKESGGSGTPKGFNDNADGLLSGDPTQTAKPAKGMDSSFNDAKAGDIGDDAQTPDDPGDPQGTGSFNDNPGL